MSVREIVPIEEYFGNGITTAFEWDWDMLPESIISVLVDWELVTDWVANGQYVVFPEAPASGVQIAQERRGDARAGHAPNGIVGGANLFITRSEFSVTVHSERGIDAVLPMWDSEEPDDPTEPPTEPPIDPPDATIIWAGDTLRSRAIRSEGEGDSGATTNIIFYMEFDDGGAEDEVNAKWLDNNVTSFEDSGWLNIEPADGTYWFRITETVSDPNHNVVVYNNTVLMPNEIPFPIEARVIGPLKIGPWIELTTYGSSPPYTSYAEVNVEICKDSGGLPDGNWSSRTVILEAIYNV